MQIPETDPGLASISQRKHSLICPALSSKYLISSFRPRKHFSEVLPEPETSQLASSTPQPRAVLSAPRHTVGLGWIHISVPMTHQTALGVTNLSSPIFTTLATLVLAADRDLIRSAAQKVLMTHLWYFPLTSQL